MAFQVTSDPAALPSAGVTYLTLGFPSDVKYFSEKLRAAVVKT